MSTPDFDLLVQLGRQRWAVALIAALAERKGGRFVELLNALGTNRESLTRTLEGCIAAGWAMRNPGHGHPLRPEYILTEHGWRAAAMCQSIEETRRQIGLGPASFARWSLPIIGRIGGGANRFNAISQGIIGANPRALTQSLKSLVGQRLVDRTVLDDYPPVPEYWLAPNGEKLAKAVACYP
jgi:DNA-binding HxlR family transcriptional regulator